MRAAMIGLGNMGSRIGARIAAGGYPIVGYDVDPGALARSPIESAETLDEAVRTADAVFLSLPDSSVIERVVFDDNGLLDCSRAGQVMIDLSTASPSSTRRIEQAFADRDVAFVDCAISGGAQAAQSGTLTAMAGGDVAALERVRPLVETFASLIYHLGASGSGQVAKLLNNFLNAISLAATAEVMIAGRAAGLDLQLLLEVLNNSSGVNFATLNRFPRIVDGDYLEGGLTNDLMAKDVRLYLDLLRELGVPSLTGAACLGAFTLASSLGYGQQISNRVVDAIGDMAGGLRVTGKGSE